MTSDQIYLNNEKQRREYRRVHNWGNDWNEYQRDKVKLSNSDALIEIICKECEVDYIK